MASSQELSDFLREVERRAFKQTVYAVRDEHTALDIVQDSMLKLAEKYADKPVAEYPMLFQRILQNTTRDFWRRQKVRNIWTTLLSSFGAGQDGEEDVSGLAELADVVAQVDQQPNHEQRRNTDRENPKKLPHDVAVQRAAQRVNPCCQRG